MSNMSISVYHTEKEIEVEIANVKDTFYTMKIAHVTHFIDSIEQLEKFAQDILLQVATLKEGINNDK